MVPDRPTVDRRQLGMVLTALPLDARGVGAAQPIVGVNPLCAIAAVATGVRVMASRQRGHLVVVSARYAIFVASTAGLGGLNAAEAVGTAVHDLVVSAVMLWFFGIALTTDAALGVCKCLMEEAVVMNAEWETRDAAAGEEMWNWRRQPMLLAGGDVESNRVKAAAGARRAGTHCSMRAGF